VLFRLEQSFLQELRKINRGAAPFKLDLGIVLDEDLDVVTWQGIPDSLIEHHEDRGRKFEAKGFTHL
jgi:hypothetical protein